MGVDSLSGDTGLYVCVFPVHLYLDTAILLGGDDCIQKRNATLSFMLFVNLMIPVKSMFCQVIYFLIFHHLERVVNVSFSDLWLNARRSAVHCRLFQVLHELVATATETMLHVGAMWTCWYNSHLNWK